MEHQMNELEEFHLSERVQGSVKTTESTQRSRRPSGKLEVSRGRIEVLIGGPTCCFLNKERLRWTDWGNNSHHTDWKWRDPCIPNTGPDWVHLRGGWSSKWKLCSRTSIIVMIVSGLSTVASIWWNLWFCSPSQAQVVGFLLVNKKIITVISCEGFFTSWILPQCEMHTWTQAPLHNSIQHSYIPGSVGDKSLYYRLHNWKFAMWIFAHELGTELPNLLLSGQRWKANNDNVAHARLVDQGTKRGRNQQKDTESFSRAQVQNLMFVTCCAIAYNKIFVSEALF